MLAQLVRFFIPSDEQQQAATRYASLVERSRDPYFFADCAVPDTLDGRFEMVLIFVYLELEKMKQEGASDDMQRRLAEAFFDDMDRSLREIGVGDTGVSHRIKKMVGAFYGRMDAYRQAWDDDALLSEALRRNAYGTLEEVPEAVVDKLMTRIRTV